MPRNARGAVSRAPHPPGGGETSVAPFLRRLGQCWSGLPHSAWRRVHPSDRSPRGPSSDRRQTVRSHSCSTSCIRCGPTSPASRQPRSRWAPTPGPVGIGPTPGFSSPPTDGRRRRGSHPGWPPSDLRREAPPSGRAHRLRSPSPTARRRIRRPATDHTATPQTHDGDAVGVRGSPALSGIRARCSVRLGRSAGSCHSSLTNRAVGCRAWLHEPAVPGEFDRTCGWVVAQTRPKRSRISVWISSFDRVASMWATNSLR